MWYRNKITEFEAMRYAQVADGGDGMQETLQWAMQNGANVVEIGEGQPGLDSGAMVDPINIGDWIAKEPTGFRIIPPVVFITMYEPVPQT